MAFETISYEKSGRVAVVTLDRPQVLNALNDTIRLEMNEAFSDAQRDKSVGCLVITGRGTRAFSVGADLKNKVTDHSVDSFEEYLDVNMGALGRWFGTLNGITKPVLGAINGLAAGSGLQVAMSCDVMIGSEHAEFWIPQITLGLSASVSTIVRLARCMGKNRTMEFVLSGRRVKAAELREVGLLSEVLPADQLMPRALEIAEQYAKLPPYAVWMFKEAFYSGLEQPLAQAMLTDRYRQFALFQTDDRRKASQAFLDRKRPG